MKSYINVMMENKTEDVRTVLAWRMLVREFIFEHRPGTLEGEVETLTNIAKDAYMQGLEDANDIFKATFNHIALETSPTFERTKIGD